MPRRAIRQKLSAGVPFVPACGRGRSTGRGWPRRQRRAIRQKQSSGVRFATVPDGSKARAIDRARLTTPSATGCSSTLVYQSA
jgi:hypothetical protein